MSVRQSGIYGIRCLPTGKVYVGSSVNIPARWYQHRMLLRIGKHHSSHLQRAWNKYGADAFVFEVIELVAVDYLLDREQYWMDELQAYDHSHGYNVAEMAGSGGDRGGRRPQTPIEQKVIISGKIRVRIDPAQEMVIPCDMKTRATAQRLMLRKWPGVERVEQLFAYALLKLAETTDD